MLYEGSPSWKAFLGYYMIAGFVALLLIAILRWIARRRPRRSTTKLLDVRRSRSRSATAFGFGVTSTGKSIKFRVTTTVIEFERGLLSKRIDVLQLWRSATSSTGRTSSIGSSASRTSRSSRRTRRTRDLEIVGMPASRQLFEQLRDSIEIQRQAKNVVGVIS